MKPLRFVGSSADDLRDFPAEARRRAGFELYSVQRGLEPTDWKPMQTIGPGVRELRIRVMGEWRIIYTAVIADAVYVLHAFQKQSKATSRNDIEVARQRLHDLDQR
jgi:phage-related protein